VRSSPSILVDLMNPQYRHFERPTINFKTTPAEEAPAGQQLTFALSYLDTNS
jgi:hypothetical protein